MKGWQNVGLRSKLGDLMNDICVVVCHFHLSQCMRKQAKNTFGDDSGKDDKIKRMKKLVDILVHAPSVTKYNSSCTTRCV